MLVVDETGFLGQGKQSVGVQRRYSGTAGRIENCQCPVGVRVYLAHTIPQGRTFLDRELYLPGEWAEDAERRKVAGAPETEELLPLTVPEVRRLLRELVGTTAPSREKLLHWSRWRRKHQMRTKHCHYRRRLARNRTELLG